MKDTKEEDYYELHVNVQLMFQHHCCGMNDGTDFASAEKWDRTWAIDGELRTMNVSVACCVTEGDFPTSKLVDEYCPIAPNSNNSYSNIVSSFTLYCASHCFACRPRGTWSKMTILSIKH